jgi:hypothetical protein
MSPRAADRFLESAQRSDADALRAALEDVADLELDSRGGRAIPEDTAALRTLLRISA